MHKLSDASNRAGLKILLLNSMVPVTMVLGQGVLFQSAEYVSGLPFVTIKIPIFASHFNLPKRDEYTFKI